MLAKLRDFVNPLKRRGLYALPHIALIAAVVLAYGLGLATGLVGRTVYDARYFQTHYKANLPTPPAGVRVVKAHQVGSLPSAASISYLSYYPAVGDQGTIGACGAWGSAWPLSYQYRLLPAAQRNYTWPVFSPRYLYDHYSDTYSGGLDEGSWPVQDLETVPYSGVPRFSQFPEPPYVIDNPIPYADAYGNSLANDAARFRIQVAVPQIAYGDGTWSSAANTVKSEIAASHPVMLAIQVPNSFDNATQTGGLVYGPGGQASRGGHLIVILKYNDAMAFPDGSVGGVLIQNQWGLRWGLNGRAWISYNWLQNYSFGTLYLTVS